MHDGLSKEGAGGSPHLFPSHSMMGLSLIGSLPLHVTLLFLYKKHHLPHAMLQSLDDPGLSSEAQQVILFTSWLNPNHV